MSAIERKPNWTQWPRVMAVRRRSATIDLLVRAMDGYSWHRTGRNAALVAHYGFLSIFPLVAVFTTILGFVLQDRPDLQADIINSSLGRIPIIGPQIVADPTQLRGSFLVLVLGLLTSLWAGMRAFVGLQGSLDDILEIPLDHRSNGAIVRVHALVAIGGVGVSQIGTAVLSSIAGITNIAILGRISLMLISVSVNVFVLGVCYRWLCSRRQSWRNVLPGAVGAGIGFSALQFVGTAVVGRAIANASAIYGTFSVVIGLITWLSLLATMALLGAEANAALEGRRREQASLASTDGITEPSESIDDRNDAS